MTTRGAASPRGASLIEVLVAMLVLAAGVLGMVGLQIGTAQNNRAALERSLATLLASDLMERMRANRGTAYPDVGEGAPGAFGDCMARPCTPAQLAAFDVVVWKCSLGRWNDAVPCQAVRSNGLLPPLDRQRGLPLGDGALARRGGLVAVTVLWEGAVPGRVVLEGR